MNLYFDNAATSWPKAPGVAEAVEGSIRECFGSPGRSNIHRSDRILFSARELIAGMIHATDSSHVVFGLNATQMINTGLLGTIKRGDRVVTTSMEHNAVSRPLRYLQKVLEIELDIVPCSPEGFLDPCDLKEAVSRSTRLAVINHASNVTGAVNDLRVLGPIVRDAGALFMVDCAQSIGTIPIDVNVDCIDLLAGSGHKGLLGPSGTGFLYFSDRVQPDPLILGGTGSHSEQDIQPLDLPDRYESGTPNITGLAGLQASLGYIQAVGFDYLTERKNQICTRMISGISTIPALKLSGPLSLENRTLVFGIHIPGKDIADLANRLLWDHGIITRTGLHCAPWAHRTAGTYPNGTIRISPGPLQEDSDIDYLLEVLDRAVRDGR